MAPITLELIRKRSEHNEGLIHSLEEISLHQEEIESISPLLGKTCKHLKIIYLQNNIISKIENLHHFKELEYLNLALNNITVIEGLGSCEMLEKLDLTLNFIDLDHLKRGIDHLRECTNLAELYMMGNPAQTKWDGFNMYVIACLPHLQRLDGTEITVSMQITAQQQVSSLEVELLELSVRVKAEKAQKSFTLDPAEPKIQDVSSKPAHGGVILESDLKNMNLADEKTPHTPEVRTKIYRELAEQKKEKDERQRSNLPKQRNFEEEHEAAIHKARQNEVGDSIRQCNEGKLNFSFDEHTDPGQLRLDIEVPRFLDSSLIDVDAHPQYVSVVIKGKVLRLNLPVEVNSGATKAQRSKTTGNLVISMPKVNQKETVGLRKPPSAKITSLSSSSSRQKISKKSAPVSMADMIIAAAAKETAPSI